MPFENLYQTYLAFLMSPFSFRLISPRTVLTGLPARSHSAIFLPSVPPVAAAAWAQAWIAA